jgi:hypothetical protein
VKVGGLILWKKYSAKSENISFIEEISFKKLKFFFYGRNFAANIRITTKKGGNLTTF